MEETKILSHSLGNGQDGFYDTFPFPPPPLDFDRRSWNALLDHLPFPGILRSPGILSRFAGSPELRRPYHLSGDAEAAEVNAFLKAVNQAFPRGPPDAARAGVMVGPRTVEKEVAGKTKQSLTAMFGDEAPLFTTAKDAVWAMSTAGPGALALVAGAPNLTWPKTHKAKDMAARLAQMLDPNSVPARQLRVQMLTARVAHASGTMEWHDVVVYVRLKKTFVYDPSAVRVNATSRDGREILECLERGQPPAGGYDARMLVNIAPAADVWAAGFCHDRGRRFGLPKSAAGAWIGGGGNIATWSANVGWTGGDCRSMCGNFLVIVHALQWASERGRTAAGLTADECRQAEDNLDWLLGGNLTAGGVSSAVNVRWEPLRMH
jgi:hypothetical protein